MDGQFRRQRRHMLEQRSVARSFILLLVVGFLVLRWVVVLPCLTEVSCAFASVVHYVSHILRHEP